MKEGMIVVFEDVRLVELLGIVVAGFAIIAFEIQEMHGIGIDDHKAKHIVEGVEDALEDVGSPTLVTVAACEAHGVDVENVFALALFHLWFPLVHQVVVVEEVVDDVAIVTYACSNQEVVIFGSTLPVIDFYFEFANLLYFGGGDR